MDSESKPRYVISIAAKMVGIECHTLRYYERLELIQPDRSSGNIRLYSEDDIERLRHIKTLINDFGVNPAGVEVVMRLIQRMKEIQRQMEDMERKIKEIDQAERGDVIESAEWREE